jgi:RpiR family glv operon transcriptional regulator
VRLDEFINKNKAKLNQTDLQIWKYIYNNRAKCRRLSIHEMAKNCCVSSTTMVRFAQKLGFDGFSEMKTVLKMEEESLAKVSADVMSDIALFYQGSFKSLAKRNFNEACRMMYSSKRIFAFSSGMVQDNVVQELKRHFIYAGITIVEMRGREEIVTFSRWMTPDDLVIIVSLSGESPVVVDVAKHLKMRDVKILSVTQMNDNTLAGLSDVNLYISTALFNIEEEENELPKFRSMVPYFMMLEIWYVKYKLFLNEIHKKKE